MEDKLYDVIIVGGGCAGMSCAITYKTLNKQGRLLVIDPNKRICEKVAIAGNGRCNIGNLKAPGLDLVKDFWQRLGIEVKANSNGWLYPLSEEGRSVQKQIEEAAQELAIDILTGTAVNDVNILEDDLNGKFQVVADNGKTYQGSKLLIASGGKACPRLGTKGDGYGFARTLGHLVKRTRPVLVPVLVKENIKKMGLSGVRTDGNVKLFCNHQQIFQEDGNIQFLDDSISGIVILNMSRHLILPENVGLDHGFDGYKVEIDLCPSMTKDQLATTINSKLAQGWSVERALTTLVKSKIATWVAEQMCQDKRNKGTHNEDLAQRASKLLKEFTLQVRGTKGWKDAQVSGGGVSLSQLDENMESKIVPGLYFAGEVTDFDGPCGGYNLQNSWYTGILAGRGMADV